MNKIIILHDTFLYKWGWERLIMMMAKILQSDIASGFFSSWSFDLREYGFQWKMIALTDEIFRNWFRHLKLKYAFLWKTKFLSEYDTVIFSWDSISAVRNCKKNTKKIYYCHTPPRYIYDLHKLYLKKVPFLLRPIFQIFCLILKKMYERDIRKMDLIFTNSKNTQKRIEKFLWLKSTILYPPVDLNEFQFIWQKDYYLSFARLSDAKRVDKIVEAFQKLPDKKIIIIHGQNDPQKQKIFDLAHWYNNISFVTLPGNSWLTEYVWECIATLYIPIDEDFWMSPVESMASWKPVIWVNEWWLKETIIDGKTWILIPRDFILDDLIQAIESLDKKKALSMKNDCEKRAYDFSIETFQKQLQEYISSV